MEPILIRGRWSLMAALGLLAFGVFLVTGMIKPAPDGKAEEEVITGPALRDFIDQRSLLEYTTVGGETLSSLARRLRIGEPQRLRDANPILVRIGDSEPLQPGLKLKVVYNDVKPGRIPTTSEER